MTSAQLGTVLRHIRCLVGACTAADLPDRQLLKRFIADHEEEAFAMLVRRHGSLVLSVCQRVLQHAHDAEDAFQATFLVLARRAASIRKQESLASWLHGVAYRIAIRAKAQAGRRRARERQVAEMRKDEPSMEATWEELAPVLDQEVQQLPEKYRAPLILCYWQGKTHKAAARELGWPVGTLSWRLVQARELLRTRLGRRGIVLSTGLLVTLLYQNGATALVPPSLLTATSQAGVCFAAGKASASAVISAKVFALTKGALKTMAVTKLKIATVLLLAVGAAGVGTGLFTHPAPYAARSPLPTAEASLLRLPHDDSAPEQFRDLPPGTQEGQDRKPGGGVVLDLYRDMTQQSGVDFTYHNGEEAGHYAILETIGGGVALIDYDSDGLLDIFVTGGGYFDGPDKKVIKGQGNRLYKNLGNWKFKDVTKEVGLAQPLFYSHGCAVADYDLDGWPDLLVTGWGRIVLYHNEPDGKGGRRFRDVTKEAGLAEKLWTTSAAWADLDGDGYPDLYVCQYVNWSFDNNPPCAGFTADVARDICPPKKFTGLPHKLYRNNGNGTFTDVSKEAGLRGFTGDPNKDQEVGKGLGVVIVDVDGDGKPDIYVTNDTVDNFLYINHSKPGKILLDEVGLSSGVARDDRGAPDGSSGTDAADFNGSGWPSLWCTHYENEMHGLYVTQAPQSKGAFLFSTQASGIAAIGQRFVGFGTGFLDIHNDGWEDLVIANGHVIRHPKGAPRKQRPVLLRNTGEKGGNAWFVDITAQGGEYFRSAHLGRGLAIGDLDNDGRPDLVISHLNEPVALLRNQVDSGQQWLGIELRGKKYRDVVGAKVVVEVDGRKLTRFAKGGGSYLSSGDRRLLFGLGDVTKIDRLTVSWPSGQQQLWDGDKLKVDCYSRLVEGKSDPEAGSRK